MELIRKFIDLVLHIDRHLEPLIQQFGPWIYVLMFLIIFCETGLVVTPILPGDSLLFALGAFAAKGSLSLSALLFSLAVAAILGDTVNYWIGARLGPRIFRGENVRFLNRKHLDRTPEFYERYGGKTIILARFVPIVRTIARDAAPNNYRFSTLVLGIVKSPAFQMKRAPRPDGTLATARLEP